MQRFRRILLVSHGFSNETQALKQALELVAQNQAHLDILIVSPSLPEEFEVYREAYENHLATTFRNSIQQPQEKHFLNIDQVRFHIEYGNIPAIKIVQQVLKGSHDLVIKDVEAREEKGFKAIDMELLRKCPCPVWLCRPVSKTIKPIKIAVAVDPVSKEAAEKDLSIKLLQLSFSLSQWLGGELNIVSCWDYPFERTLTNNAFIHISEEKIRQIVLNEQMMQLGSLENLIKESNISQKYRLAHLKGYPAEVIPEFIEENKINLLVMGTLGRTGISGFIVGNTAENILQKIGCSLLALKPNGFVSPILPY